MDFNNSSIPISQLLSDGSSTYLYVLTYPVLLADPSGEIVPILLLASAGFVAGALFNAWQQTNGFTTWCHFDVMQALAWGVGGAAAVSWFAILSVGAIGMAGLGMQGIALGLYSLGISMPVATTLQSLGMATSGGAAIASLWLWTGNSPNPLFVNPVGVANSRASTLQAALPQRSYRVTMTAGVVEDSLGTRQVVIGTSEPRGYIRPTVRALINQDEIVVIGSGHAEENIVNWATVNNQQVIAIGAGRPICIDCARAIENSGGILASPVRPR